MIKLCVLDAKTLGSDIDLNPIKQLGETAIYELTNEDEVISRIKDREVIITNKVILNESNLKEAAGVKLIALTATGYNNIDLDYVKSRGIAVVNVAGYSTNSVVQHTFAILFQLLEQLSFYDNYVKSRAYVQNDTFAYIERSFYEINGKTWGIIGMGAIGKAVAKAAEAFGAKVIYYSTSGQNNSVTYESVTLEQLLSKSDIVSIHAPMNQRTNNLITYEKISQMQPHAILMNLGRGGIVNEEDLAKALNENLIRGAALDVLEKEPIAANNALFTVKDQSKWLITPHIAWASIEARTLLVQEVAANISAFVKGEVRNRII